MKKISAHERDAQDELAHFKKEFYLPKDAIYLDGNSLGLLSRAAEHSSLKLLKSWKELGIEGWTKGDHPWFFLAEELATLMAPLVGANKGEAITTSSTTVNLHQLLATFYKPQGKRVKILADELAFPSDIYAIKSHLELHDLNPETNLLKVKSRDGYTITEEDIISLLSDEVAVAILPSVLYRSGQLLNINKITQAAHQKGVLLGIDAAHSVGAVPHTFHKDNIDFAFWCTYKYLNGGPGSVGGLFVHQRHLHQTPGLAGWFSSDKTRQFEMNHQLTPAPDAGAYQIATPAIMSMAALIGSLKMFDQAGLDAIRAKSIQLTDYLIELIDRELSNLGVEVVTPRDPERRGGHVAIIHQQADLITKSLRHFGVIPDFRPPHIIRLAPIALYTSFSEVEQAVQIIKKIIVNKEYLKDAGEVELVT